MSLPAAEACAGRLGDTMRTYLVLVAAVGWAGALSFACSGSTTGGFGGNQETGADSGGAGSSSSSGSSGGGSSGGTSSGFMAGEAGLGTGTCQTGLYSGTFSCLFYYGSDAGPGMAPDSGGVGPITGTMSFMLSQDVSTNGELSTTDTASGSFLAATGGFISAIADLTGTLQCGTGKFNGMLVNGEYGLSFTGAAPLPDPNNKFQGPLSSDYNGTTSSFVNGELSMAIKGEGACIGSWMASYAGPGDGGASTGVTDTGAGGQ